MVPHSIQRHRFAAWELPPWSLRLVIVMVLGGFPITVHELRLDPTWDAFRGHPRFQQMLAQAGAAPNE